MEERFDISAAESLGHVHAGTFKTQSLEKTSHRVRLTADGGVIFVCLFSKKECHIDFLCKVWQGGTQNFGAERGKLTGQSDDDDDEDDDKHLKLVSASVGMKLQAKLKHRRQELKDHNARTVRAPVVTAAAAQSGNVLPLSPLRSLGKGRQLKDFIWDGMEAPHSEEDTANAQRRLMRLWIGNCSKYSDNVPRAKGQWVRKLSAECPRKIIKFLRKAVQDRSALTTVAIVGAFAFFRKRQTELHFMRARTAMRQLVWYKALFAASRIRYLVCLVAKNRELEKKRARDRSTTFKFM
jgi:hypothetical protein